MQKKIKPHRTENVIDHLLDIYADNLTIYPEYNRKSNWCNRENVRRVLEVMNRFYVWSRLRINLSKTHLNILGKVHRKPAFIEELKIEWCINFELLGIYFHITLSNMQVNYEKAVESVKNELHS